MWMLNGAGWWAIENRETGDFMGIVGAFYRETDLEGGQPGDVELGWVLLRRFWRQGYAAEAAAAALAYGRDVLRAPRIIAYIDPGNAASIAVSARIGMRLEADADFYGTPTRRYVFEPS